MTPFLVSLGIALAAAAVLVGISVLIEALAKRGKKKPPSPMTREEFLFVADQARKRMEDDLAKALLNTGPPSPLGSYNPPTTRADRFPRYVDEYAWITPKEQDELQAKLSKLSSGKSTILLCSTPQLPHLPYPPCSSQDGQREGLSKRAKAFLNEGCLLPSTPSPEPSVTPLTKPKKNDSGYPTSDLKKSTNPTLHLVAHELRLLRAELNARRGDDSANTDVTLDLVDETLARTLASIYETIG